MTAATTNRRLLIALAAIGVVAGLVGIGASIAGVDDDRGATGSATTAASPPPGEGEETAEDEAAAETEEPALEDEEAAEEEAEARLEAEAAVSRAEAEAIARAEVPGTVDRARISDEGWEVRIDAEDGHVDVLVDADTGAVLEVDD